MGILITAAIRLLESMFAVGAIGLFIVLVLTAIEDIEHCRELRQARFAACSAGSRCLVGDCADGKQFGVLCSRLGLSSKTTAQEQAFELGRAWEGAPEPKRPFVFRVIHPDRQVDTFPIGSHTPSITAEDVHLIQRLWLNITREPGLDKLHHHDIVSETLTRFAREYAGRDRQDILKELRKTCNAPARGGGDGNRPAALGPAQKARGVSRKDDEGPPSPPVCGP